MSLQTQLWAAIGALVLLSGIAIWTGDEEIVQAGIGAILFAGGLGPLCVLLATHWLRKEIRLLAVRRVIDQRIILLASWELARRNNPRDWLRELDKQLGQDGRSTLRWFDRWTGRKGAGFALFAEEMRKLLGKD